MKISLNGLSLAVAAALPFVSFSSVAMFNGADARGGAMGGTGVASAQYLTASFYNPAMATNYTKGDDFGMILPMIAAGVHDSDELYDKIDEFQKVNDRLSKNPSQETLEEWKQALLALDNGELDMEVITGASVALPNRYASANLFLKAQVASMVKTTIVESDLVTSDPDNLSSSVQGVAGGTVDMGVTLAREFAMPFQGHRLSVGVSPKFQKIMALNYMASVSEFEDSDFDLDDREEDNTFNLDVGLAYKPAQNLTVGLVVQNLLKQELETNISRGTKATFLVEPKYTAGVAYENGWLLVAADLDLNKQRYFTGEDYETQFARAGIELDAWRWVQVRAGYSHSMTDFSQDMLTAGLGFTPFGLFGLELAGQYGEDEHYGVAAQLAFMF
ncbi:conjugal transfer protein TraF [uncultured Photobacterium sp.]|uniref:conjugal transfer protein TraF n=1 Tax=uncultured Photobacterium sp. TaxID=173973 RepID=UPI00262B700D|nr:conjugal transfer protein TraF [uncultured Photobacterium sp.]